MAGTTAAIAHVPASIAVFQHDYDRASLRFPVIVALTEDIVVIESSSDLWENSIMRRRDQDLPHAGIALEKLEKLENAGHRLLFPHGSKNIKVMVDHDCLPPEAMKTGFHLEGGELVRIYSTHWLAHGRVIDEWAGPLSFQYRQAFANVDLRAPKSPSPLLGGKPTMDQLPKAILRLIFSYLPVDEALHNIPAVCTKFLDTAEEEMDFHRWVIAGGCPTPRESAFCQAWTTGAISTVVLTRLPMTTKKEWHCIGRFFDFDLNPNRNSIEEIECHLLTSSSEANKVPNFMEAAIFRLMDLISKFPNLKRLKLSGLPFLPLKTYLFRKFGKLEKLWLQYETCLLYERDALVGPLVPNLKTITLAFTAEDELGTREGERFHSVSAEQFLQERHLPQQPKGIEEVFAAFAPLEGKQTRVFVLSGKAAAWSKFVELLGSQLNRLEALCLTVDDFLEQEQSEALLNSLPESVKVLKITTETFNDEFCQKVADKCPNLEVFACNATDVSHVGVNVLVEKCEKLERLFLLHQRKDGTFMPRLAILPEKFQGRVRGFEHLLKKVFD